MLARRFLSALLATGLLAFASNPATAATKKKAAKPADATGECVDGTYTRAKTQQGACSSHGGVKTWYGEAAAAAAPATTPSAAPASTVRAPKPARTSKAATPAPPSTEAVPPTPPPTATGSATKPAITAPAAGTPADATAKCKDGTYSHSKQHSGTCSHHGGVAEWYK